MLQSQKEANKRYLAKKSTLHIRLNKDTYQALKDYCNSNQISVNQFAIDCMTLVLERNGEQFMSNESSKEKQLLQSMLEQLKHNERH